MIKSFNQINKQSIKFISSYRGFDCRNNLFYLPCTPDVVVYHTAAVGVVLNKSQRSQKFYVGHGDDILSLAVHPAKDIVATGEVRMGSHLKFMFIIFKFSNLHLN